MSWLAYEKFTLQPDFTKPPQFGIDDDRDVVESPGGGNSFASWNGTTDRTFLFDFQTHAADEWRQLREFFDRHGGRARAFYLPTWQHDFELAADASIGATLIELAGHWFADNVTEDRPDTLGRTLFIVNQLGQVAVHRVVGFSEAGGNDVVQLETPTTILLVAGRCMVGFCHLSRLTNDTIESEHLSTDHARATLGFRSVNQTRRVDQTETAAGVEIGNLNANFEVVATDTDPIYDNPRRAEALGPFILAAPQGANFQTEWIATLDPVTNLVTLKAGSYETTTTVYNAPGPATQIALTFDAASKEVLTWAIDGKVWIGWISGGSTVTRINFDGFSPVAFNTYGIDSTVNAGTATVAVFYLKQNDSTIFCRIISEDFGIEHRYCNSPLAPLYLHAARRNEGKLEIVGMDAGHRLAIWKSEGYLTPPEIQVAIAYFNPEIAGIYQEVTVLLESDDRATAAFDELVAGEYRSIKVATAADEPDGPVAGFVALISGAYVDVRKIGTTEPQLAKFRLSDTIPGTYTEKAKIISAEDPGPTASFATTISGTYS